MKYPLIMGTLFTAILTAQDLQLIPYTGNTTVHISALRYLAAQNLYKHESRDTTQYKKKDIWHIGDIASFMNYSKKNIFFENACDLRKSIKAWHLYMPKNADSLSLIVIIHGTGANNAEWYRKTDHEQFQGFLKFAKTMAHENNTAIDCISFGWSGKNSIEERLKADSTLAEIIEDISDRYDKIVVIAHSHGANVAFAASNTIPKIPITIIALAAPIRESNRSLDEREQMFIPQDGAKTVVNIYSTADCIQPLGSIRSGHTFFDLYTTMLSLCTKGSSRKIETTDTNNRYFNLELTIDGKSPGHSAIRTSVFYLYPLIQELLKRPNGNYDGAISTTERSCLIKSHGDSRTLSTSQWLMRKIFRASETGQATVLTVAAFLLKTKNQIDCTNDAVAIA